MIAESKKDMGCGRSHGSIPFCLLLKLLKKMAKRRFIYFILSAQKALPFFWKLYPI